MKARYGRRAMEDELYEKRAAICKAFANPVRLKILDLVGNKACAVADLRRRLGVSEANLSQHLAVLKAAGVIATSRTGKRVFCHIAIPEVQQACSLVCDVLRAQVRNGRRLVI